MPSHLSPSLVVALVVSLGLSAACSSSSSDDTPPDSGTLSSEDGSAPLRCASPPCANGEACTAPSDCASGLCSQNTCLPAQGVDGVKNGTETDVDCGGDPTGAARCADGRTCSIGSDCSSAFCKGGICTEPTHNDGVKNLGETDIDCGGSQGAPPCDDGRACVVGATDCESKVCTGSVCQAPTHTDKVKNGDETGIDCGGPTSGVKCADTDGCDDAEGVRDCQSGVCKNRLCQSPTHADKVKNGDETGVDCGGPTSGAKCKDLDGCVDAEATRDCESLVCKNGVCQVPTDSDLVKNGGETDVDCGGPNGAKRCKAEQACATGNDCASKGCNVNGKCAWARSCTMHHGGDTCGVGDETAAQVAGSTFASGNKEHHDCCESAVVDPNNVPDSGDEFRLDKYQITAGRMRRFIEAVGGNVRKWVQDARNNTNGESFRDPGAAAQLPLANDIYLPTGRLTGESATTVVPPDNSFAVMQTTSSMNVTAHLGGYRFTTEPGGGGGYGCEIKDGNYGARTYRLDDDQLAFYGEKQHSVSKERLDQKALTCVDYFMLAAFCAWDGGRLETKTEHAKAWGPATFPWGSDGGTQGFQYALGDLRFGGNVNVPGDLIFNATPTNPGNWIRANLERTNVAWIYGNYIVRDTRRYLEGRGTLRSFLGESDAALGTTSDQSFAVAPPGRFPSGSGKWGHQDLFGNAMEITAEFETLNGRTAYRWTKNGSFESYTHFSGPVGYNGYRFGGLAKYGRATGRCARPLAAP